MIKKNIRYSEIFSNENLALAIENCLRGRKNKKISKKLKRYLALAKKEGCEK